jgi:hypothetical protein
MSRSRRKRVSILRKPLPLPLPQISGQTVFLLELFFFLTTRIGLSEQAVLRPSNSSSEWKRTGGWQLPRIFVHSGPPWPESPYLSSHRIFRNFSRIPNLRTPKLWVANPRKEQVIEAGSNLTITCALNTAGSYAPQLRWVVPDNSKKVGIIRTDMKLFWK